MAQSYNRMPRLPRINFPDAVFHVMSRGNGGQNIFLEDSDRSIFLRRLRDIKTDSPFKLYAYCLMSNHFHFLIQISQIPLAAIMQRFLTGYSRYFNSRHDTYGHLFQGRYKAILCDTQSYLLQSLRYIHLNPNNAGLVENPSDWRWSSHRKYLGINDDPIVDADFPLSIFDRERNQARRLFQNFVMEGLGISDWSSLLPPTRNQEDIIVENTAERDNSPENNLKFQSLEVLESLAAIQTGVPLVEMRGKSRLHSATPGRRAFVFLALEQGHAPSKIATYLGCSPSAISKIIRRTKEASKCQA